MPTEKNHRADSKTPVDIAIVGMSAMFPDAHNLSEYWQNIQSGRDSIKDIPLSHWKPQDYFDADPKSPDMTYAKSGGFLSEYNFDPLKFGIPPQTIEATDTSQLLGMVAAHEAMLDAGYDPKNTDLERVSCIMGVTGALELVIPLGARLGHPHWKKALDNAGIDPETRDEILSDISDSYVGWQEASFPGLLGNVVAGRIANHLNIGGTNTVVDSACGSSLSAVHSGVLELCNGTTDMVITGGTDTFNDIFMYMCFSKTPALSPRGHACSYDEEGDGTTLGEGIGIVILKRLEDAERDQDRIYAVIKGVGSSSDGHGTAIYAPKSSGQAKALKKAYEQAQINPSTVTLIEGHGTGTRVGDGVEINGLKEVFGTSDTQHCALGSVKSQIGHTKAAAGAAGLIKATMALYQQVLPPTIKVKAPHKSLEGSPFYVNGVSRPWIRPVQHPRRAGISAFGFGGSNFHVVLEEHLKTAHPEPELGQIQIVPFSGSTKQGIASELEQVSAQNWLELRHRALKQRQQYKAQSCRLVIIASDLDSWNKAKSDALSFLKTDQSTSKDQPHWVYGEGPIDPKVALLFPGQGSQSSGMLQDLALAFSPIKEMLEFLETKHPEGVLKDLYPALVHQKQDRTSHDEALRATQLAQPAIGAVSAGALDVLKSFGLKPDAAAGHSFGELTALYAAGALNREQFLTLAMERGRLMAASGPNLGSMIAVSSDKDTVESFLRDEGIDLIIANFNSPTQVVISGSDPEIQKALVGLKKRGLTHTKLPVGAAFHSPTVASSAAPFKKVVAKQKPSKPKFKVYANTTAKAYPQSSKDMIDLLGNQLAKPVLFQQQISQMHQDGYRLFVEIGPKKHLSNLGRQILKGQDAQFLTLDRAFPGKHGLWSLAHLLGSLAAAGVTIRLDQWDAKLPELPNPKRFTIPISGANYRQEVPQKKRGPKPQKIRPTQKTIDFKEVQVKDNRPSKPQQMPKPAPQSPRTPDGSTTFFQESLLALQKLQMQNAKLHEQYLKGQEQAQTMFAELIGKQQGIPASQPQRTYEPQVTAPAPRPIEQKVVARPAPTPKTIQAPKPRPTSAPAPKVQQPPASKPAPAPAAAPVQASAPSVDVAGLIFKIVSEKTGYPTEMLQNDMNLETDLGIDSIKKVEILASLAEAHEPTNAIPSDELNGVQTIAEILAKLQDVAPAEPLAAPTPAPAPQVAAAPKPNAAAIPARAIVMELVSQKTGYPVDMLDDSMDLESDLGIDSIKKVEILAAISEHEAFAGQFNPQDNHELRTLGQVIEQLGNVPQVETAPIKPQVQVQPQTMDGGADFLEGFLAIVAEKTGYPTDMLTPDMDLESDLGIDSIKRVEILGAAGEEFASLSSIPQEDFNNAKTIQDICNVYGQNTAPSPSQPSKTLASPSNDLLPEEGDDDPSSHLIPLERIVISTSPVPKNHKQQPIDLPKGSRIWVTDDGGELAKTIRDLLREKGHKVKLIKPSTIDRLKEPTKLEGLFILAPEEAKVQVQEQFVREAFKLSKLCSKALRASSKESGGIFATVTRCGGDFGIKGLDQMHACYSAGLAGITKTASHEWPEVHCKAIDVSTNFLSAEMAAVKLLEEFFLSGLTEVGITPDGPLTPGLNRKPIDHGTANEDTPPINEGDLVVITGGARGVTKAACLELAENFKPSVLLIGRSPMPEKEASWLSKLTEEAEIKRELFKRHKGQTPKEIEATYRGIVRAREIRDTFDQLAALGVQYRYAAIDGRNKSKMKAAIQNAQDDFGPIKGVIHGAGVLHDRYIADKTLTQFNEVVDTKIKTLNNIMKAIDPQQLKILVLFSSSTGRYGRKGQVDYAIANEILNKMAQYYRSTLPRCRTMAVGWGPWNGGMVDSGLKAMFEKEGIGIIPLKQGAEHLLDEINLHPGREAEVVVLAKAGEPRSQHADHPNGNGSARHQFEQKVSVKDFPVLKDHVINHKAVIPLALMMEWVGNAALHNHPGMKFVGLEDFQVLKGVKIDRDESITLHYQSEDHFGSDGSIKTQVEVRSQANSHGGAINYRGTAILKKRFPTEVKSQLRREKGSFSRSIHEAYADMLFHGQVLMGIEEISGSSKGGMTALAKQAPQPKKWIRDPWRSRWLSDPLLLDSAFQMLVLWTQEHWGEGSLPLGFKSYEQYGAFNSQKPYEIRVKAVSQSKPKVMADVEFLDHRGKVVAVIKGCDQFSDSSLASQFQDNKIANTQQDQLL